MNIEPIGYRNAHKRFEFRATGGWHHLLFWKEQKAMSKSHFQSLTQFINNIHPGAASHLKAINELDKEVAYAILSEILRYSTATFAAAILAGRESFNSLPSQWVRDNLRDAAPRMIDLNDEWDYRRLLELLVPNYPDLLEHFARLGVLSDKPEIAEAAADFLQSE